jgi:hypothetical protein
MYQLSEEDNVSTAYAEHSLMLASTLNSDDKVDEQQPAADDPPVTAQTNDEDLFN